MISKKEVINIAKLARIKITGEEAEEFQKEFSAILDYFEVLKKIEGKEKKNNYSSDGFRKDEIEEFTDNTLEKGKYFKVKEIFSNDN